MDSEKTPRRRLTPPEAFPDLDAALAARGIALKAKARRIEIDVPEEPVAEFDEASISDDERSQPHIAAFAGAILGLVLIGLIVISVFRVSDESSRPDSPMLTGPTASVDAPAPALAASPAPAPAPAPPAEVSAQPVAAPPPAPLPSASPPEPPALFNASNLTAQTMVTQPPPAPELTPEESMRAHLQERFPRLFLRP